jgi:hypothetical protein
MGKETVRFETHVSGIMNAFDLLKLPAPIQLFIHGQ